MKFKRINPTTPSQRGLIQIKQNSLGKKPFIKTKIYGLKNSSGRNNSGKITIRHRGGGHKQKYREIDFYRKEDFTGIVTSIEYDPNRNANIAAVYSSLTKSYSYILAPKNLCIGHIVKAGSNAEPKLGHSLSISKIPVGSFIHNVCAKSNKKSQLARAAGTFCQLIEKTSKQGRIRLSSGEQRLLSINCIATLGIVSNDFSFLTTLGKAVRARKSSQSAFITQKRF